MCSAWARTQLTDDEFRERMHEGASESSDARNFSEDGWKDFASRLHSWSAMPIEREFYPPSRQDRRATEAGASKNILFYVSTPASLAPPIVEGLGQVWAGEKREGWTRIVLEKPFGRDLASAHELNEIVSNVFEEESVYRIDHYLGKETVQNIMVFRFGNSDVRAYLEPQLHRLRRDHGGRNAGRGEPGGVLRRDRRAARHGRQPPAAIVDADRHGAPVAFDADSVREQKVQVLRAIRPMTVDEVAQRTIRGQYGPGRSMESTSRAIARNQA